MPDFERNRSLAGAAFVAGSAALVTSASWLLPGTDHQRLGACAIAAGMAFAGLIAWLLIREDRGLLAYPLIAFGGVGALGAVDETFGTSFAGLLTLGFIYLGLCGTRRTVVIALAPAVACWSLANGAAGGSLSSAAVVRLPIALVIWLTVGLLLSQHTRRVNDQALMLQDQAHRDPMTGLHNRRALADLSKSATTGDAVVLLDLDRFKWVNDTFGHLAGDTLLCDFSELLKASLRTEDSAVRYGGEEFLLFLPGTTTEQLRLVLDRVRANWLARSPVTTFSAGAALIGPDRGIIEALGRADQRLYAAKTSGRNRCVVDGAEPSIPLADAPMTLPASRQSEDVQQTLS